MNSTKFQQIVNFFLKALIADLCYVGGKTDIEFYFQTPRCCICFAAYPDFVVLE